MTAIVTARCASLGVNEAARVLRGAAPCGAPGAAHQPRARATAAGFTAVAAIAVCGALAALPGLRPPGITDLQLAILGLATLATAMVSAGYSFLQGCSRFGSYGLVMATGP